MDVKAFLRKIRAEHTELELLLLKKNNIILIHALRFDKDKIQTNSRYTLEDQAIKDNGLILAIDNKIKSFQEHQLQAYDLISSLDNELQRSILIMYYLSRKKSAYNELSRPYSLEEVAEELNYTESYVKHIHGDALNALREKKKYIKA
jgi:DNA-directed RNA polymerase sigma subunit (sigma70/sigma32)